MLSSAVLKFIADINETAAGIVENFPKGLDVKANKSNTEEIVYHWPPSDADKGWTIHLVSQENYLPLWYPVIKRIAQEKAIRDFLGENKTALPDFIFESARVLWNCPHIQDDEKKWIRPDKIRAVVKSLCTLALDKSISNIDDPAQLPLTVLAEVLDDVPRQVAYKGALRRAIEARGGKLDHSTAKIIGTAQVASEPALKSDSATIKAALNKPARLPKGARNIIALIRQEAKNRRDTDSKNIDTVKTWLLQNIGTVNERVKIVEDNYPAGGKDSVKMKFCGIKTQSQYSRAKKACQKM